MVVAPPLATGEPVETELELLAHRCSCLAAYRC
jgi:hypothetical protein